VENGEKRENGVCTKCRERSQRAGHRWCRICYIPAEVAEPADPRASRRVGERFVSMPPVE
jgi:hypothetical protein